MFFFFFPSLDAEALSGASMKSKSVRLFGGLFSSSSAKKLPLSLASEKEEGGGEKGIGDDGGVGGESGSESGREGGSSSVSTSPLRRNEKKEKDKDIKEGKEEKKIRSAWAFPGPLRGSNRKAAAGKSSSANAEKEEENVGESHAPFSSSLDFLNLGFQELVKCRQVNQE